MQVVGEKLSLHVLANYEEFVRGVNEVASIEKDLQVCIPAVLLQWLMKTATPRQPTTNCQLAASPLLS